MDAVIAFNPLSGRGEGARLAGLLRARLSDVGAKAELVSCDQLERMGSESSGSRRVLFVVGGDGTVHRALEAARAAGRAIYHIPTGTENLFGREFGITRDLDLAVRSLGRGEVREVDLGACRSGGTTTSFAIMCSVGPDAGVIQRLSASRTGPIRHLSYLRPIVSELMQLQLPSLWIEADGHVLTRGERGMVVVANSRQYAMRLDPAPMAEMDDGWLDVAYFPAESRVELLTQLLASRCRRGHEMAGVVYRRAKRVGVWTSSAWASFQLDGEPGRRPSGEGNLELCMEVVPSALRVLLPAVGGR